MEQKLKKMTKDELLGFRVLSRLGGPIMVEHMEERPTLEQWMRYFLYRLNVNDAAMSALQFYANGVKRPLLDIDIEAVGFKSQ